MSGLDYRASLIQQAFNSYGYTPDPGVIEALVTSIGADNQEGIVAGEVGGFMNAVNQINKAAATDPLTKLLVEESAAVTSTGAEAADLSTQLQSTFTQAPKLFGALTPEQIDQYLQPTKNAFDYGLGAIEGEAAKKGNTGSSLEANALAQSQTQFQQNVLNQGLQVGQDQQKNEANVLQNLYNSKLSQQNLLYGLQSNTAGQISQQQYQNAQFLAQLPLLLNAYATQQMQLRNQQNSSSGGWENILGTVLGGAAGGVGGYLTKGPMGAIAGASAGSNLGGAIANDITGASGPTQTGAAFNLLPLLYGASSGAYNSRTGTTSAASGFPGATSFAGSTLNPAALSLIPQSNYGTASSGSSNPAGAGLNWTSQPGMLLGG